MDKYFSTERKIRCNWCGYLYYVYKVGDKFCCDWCKHSLIRLKGQDKWDKMLRGKNENKNI